MTWEGKLEIFMTRYMNYWTNSGKNLMDRIKDALLQLCGKNNYSNDSYLFSSYYVSGNYAK